MLAKWGKLLTITGGAQVAIQGIGFVSGILILRFLSVEEYAYYTLLNSMLGTMTNLADGGISTGVMSESGKCWRDREKLGRVLATGMKLRKQFAIASLLVSLPILYYLLQDKGLPWWQSLLMILSVGPAFWAALSGSLLSVVPKLHQDIDDLLKINVSINVVRLLVTIPAILIFPLSGVAILGSGVGQVFGNFKLRKLSAEKADWDSPSDPEARKAILNTVKRILPGTLYYCISGQIVVWLVAIFSTTESLAQIGALSRLVMVLTLVKMVANMLILPRYARLPDVKRLVVPRFYQVMLILVTICSSIVLFAGFFPNVCLWILGKNYADLEYELVLMITSGCLSMLSGMAYHLTSSRGIIPNPYAIIASTIAIQVITLAFIVDFTTLAGVISFSIISSAGNLIYRLIHFIYYTEFKKDWSATIDN